VARAGAAQLAAQRGRRAHAHAARLAQPPPVVLPQPPSRIPQQQRQHRRHAAAQAVPRYQHRPAGAGARRSMQRGGHRRQQAARGSQEAGVHVAVHPAQRGGRRLGVQHGAEVAQLQCAAHRHHAAAAAAVQRDVEGGAVVVRLPLRRQHVCGGAPRQALHRRQVLRWRDAAGGARPAPNSESAVEGDVGGACKARGAAAAPAPAALGSGPPSPAHVAWCTVTTFRNPAADDT
jgi:hypothetical protein